MNTEFKIIHSDNKTVVILISNRRLPEIVSDIEGNFRKDNYSGYILIDLLLTNGLNNRFIEIPVDNGTFIMSKAKPTTKIEDKLLFKINKYFQNHKERILNSHISRVEKNKILTTLSTLL
jgi:hypothetical protein